MSGLQTLPHFLAKKRSAFVTFYSRHFIVETLQKHSAAVPEIRFTAGVRVKWERNMQICLWRVWDSNFWKRIGVFWRILVVFFNPFSFIAVPCTTLCSAQ
jgi:hypothetical protein